MSSNGAVIGPYHQDASRSFLYCMLGDEPLMFKRREELNPYQRQHVDSMRFDILPWAMCFAAISRPQDEVYLDELFLEKERFFAWHRAIYARVGLVPSERLRFKEPSRIYAEALKARRSEQLVSTVCFSHQVQDACDVSEKLAVSKRVNSKIDLIRRAEKAGFQIPRSAVLAKRDLTLKAVRRLFDFPKRGLILKTDGLGGGFNVKGLSTFADCASFAKDFSPDSLFILQEKIDRTRYSEFIADYAVRPSGAEFLAARLKLTADNRWFGNVYSPRLAFNERQIQNLGRCVEDVRAQGYCAEAGYICGVDFFQSEDDQLITEINARWTGGLPVAILLRRLGLGQRVVYSHVDELLEADIPLYQTLVEKHLWAPGKKRPSSGFQMLPVSFSPKVADGKLYVWFCVIGDYHAFARERRRHVSKASLPLARIVDQLAREKRALIHGAAGSR